MADVARSSRAPRILDLVDADSQKWADLATIVRLPGTWLYRREHHVLRKVEQEALATFDALLVTTPRERSILARTGDVGRVSSRRRSSSGPGLMPMR